MTTATPAAKAASSTPPAKKSKAAAPPQATVKKTARAPAKPVAKKPATARAAAPVAAQAPAKRAPKPKTVVGGKPPKAKLKLVRDSFTMPQADFELIDMLKQRALDFRHSAKKSELLRAGLQVLAALPHDQLQAALERITALKPGRPKKAD